MNNRYTVFSGLKRRGKRSTLIGGIAVLVMVLMTLGGLSRTLLNGDPAKEKTVLAATTSISEGVSGSRPVDDDGLWDGPVLYHHPPGKPIQLILIEKSKQKLDLYRFDGRYRLIKSYFCATGEKKGKKRAEKDEKTPEGIYFNNKTFRDRKVTVFGDRAFGLNYPDFFDTLEGNRGSGIFIHGSNKKVAPYSSNGCLVLNNKDLADLDQRVDFKQTPVIIGDVLPYRFGAVKKDLSELLPFLKKAALPEKHAGKPSEYHGMTIVGYKDRVVATSLVQIGDRERLLGTSRLYLAGPGRTLLVLVKREWSEEKIKAVAVKPADSETAAKAKPKGDRHRIAATVESWRRAWQGKRLNAYIGHYHPAFSSKGRNLSDWKAYKGKLNARNRKISVRVSNLRIRVNDPKASVYFRQYYRSDTFRSSSYKVLEFRKKGGSWKIYRENSYPRKPAGWPS